MDHIKFLKHVSAKMTKDLDKAIDQSNGHLDDRLQTYVEDTADTHEVILRYLRENQ